uniref:Uncharacterized protein n=1 Tax=Hucho hucho TaxID=62062 RepID=A0A4W5KC73_9TELE
MLCYFSSVPPKPPHLQQSAGAPRPCPRAPDKPLPPPPPCRPLPADPRGGGPCRPGQAESESQSGIPSDNLSLLQPQADGKLANRDSGIDSISSPSHSEELCFAGDEDRVIFPCSPGASAEGGGDSEGDSDLEEGSGDETIELINPMMDLQPLALALPKTDRQDSTEVANKQSEIC